MITLSEIERIIKDSGLSAQFRMDGREDWEKVVKLSSYVPTVYAWHFVNYNTVYFHIICINIYINIHIYFLRKTCFNYYDLSI